MTRAPHGRETRFPAADPLADVAVIGLGVSGDAAARLALERGAEVYVSDLSTHLRTQARAQRLEALGAGVELGRHDVQRIARSGLVVVSPGVPQDAPVLQALRARGVRWISEPEFAAHFHDGALIAVTGTNGKTTTAVLTGHLLDAAGVDAAVGGNVGGDIAPPASALARRSPPPAWWVLEMSSFQLAGTRRFSPEIGVLTNLSADHLDRYEDLSSYFADKEKLFQNATRHSRWVVNGDDPAALEMARRADGELHLFAANPPDPQEATDESTVSAFVRDGVLTLRVREPQAAAGPEEALVPRDELRLLGQHNVMNALAAALTARLAGAAVNGIRQGLATFDPLPHRLEPVAERRGVLWVNDSKATNVSATLSALRSLERPVVLLLGGRDKGEDPSPLVPLLRTCEVRAVTLYGETGERWARKLSEAMAEDAGGAAVPPLVTVDEGFDAAVAAARLLAVPGDAVLLSPACPSFDLFESYEARGRRFRHLAVQGSR